ncbi:uncharacterized protein LOC115451642 [Manduca sexta]|uniref:uncharacterized protein LOC115451642 n=1 Tax=Manduca sexta TaxID=7130 RepID=UPI0018908BB2|nr:uncharacterized protein LOC115451642 [Manduca sexta]
MVGVVQLGTLTIAACRSHSREPICALGSHVGSSAVTADILRRLAEFPPMSEAQTFCALDYGRLIRNSDSLAVYMHRSSPRKHPPYFSVPSSLRRAFFFTVCLLLIRRAFYCVLARCTITDSKRTGELPPDHVQLRTTIVGCADPTDCRRAAAGADHVHTTNVAGADPDHVHTLLTHVAFQLPGELPPEPATCNIYVPFAWIGVPQASDSCCVTPATSTECNAEV